MNLSAKYINVFENESYMKLHFRGKFRGKLKKVASVEIFNCSGKVIIGIVDCSIRVTCSYLTVLIDYLDF